MFRNFELSPTRVLRALFWLRLWLVGTQIMVLALAIWVLSLELPLVPIGATILAQIAWNSLAYWRLTRPWIATHAEVFLNLAVDTWVFTILLYFAGGATNPFVSLYLLPIAVAAAALPALYIWSISLWSAASYTFLVFFHIPLPPAPSRFGSEFHLHVLGMWVNFILSALVLAVFVSAIAAAVRQRDRSLAEAREDALRNEQIVALGTLSAGVAHEINTPLGTMTVLVDELRDLHGRRPEIAEPLGLLKSQIEICRDKVSTLLDTTGAADGRGGRPMALRDFVEDIIDQWQVVRPEIDLHVEVREPFEDPRILADPTLIRSVGNLLNNAADASTDNCSTTVSISAASADECLTLLIDDEGKGIGASLADKAGRAFFSTKEDGTGVGLVLSNASIGRYGGEVRLGNRPSGGARTEVSLPLTALIVSESVNDAGQA